MLRAAGGVTRVGGGRAEHVIPPSLGIKPRGEHQPK